MSNATEALKKYQHADSFGIYVTVSQQAVDETLVEYAELEAENERLRNALMRLLDERGELCPAQIAHIAGKALEGEKNNSG